MMLSNETGDAAVQQKAIVTMGDTLGTDALTDTLTGCNVVSARMYIMFILCCPPSCSLQRPLTCRPCVLPDSQRSLRDVHTEGREAGASQQQPQVSCILIPFISLNHHAGRVFNGDVKQKAQT